MVQKLSTLRGTPSAAPVTSRPGAPVEVLFTSTLSRPSLTLLYGVNVATSRQLTTPCRFAAQQTPYYSSYCSPSMNVIYSVPIYYLLIRVEVDAMPSYTTNNMTCMIGTLAITTHSLPQRGQSRLGRVITDHPRISKLRGS